MKKKIFVIEFTMKKNNYEKSLDYYFGVFTNLTKTGHVNFSCTA